MQPSSLIFLVIVVIWAAYMIQHWIHRREHLATARSVDKFSEAMRVLERRNPLPMSQLATSRPDPATPHGSTAVVRPEVVVQRATVSSPLRARATDPATRWAHTEPLAPALGAGGLLWQPSRASVVLRRVRGVFFLVALVAVPVTVAMSALHILKWLSVGIALAGLIAAVVWLRIAARRDQTVRRDRRAMERRLRERAKNTGRAERIDRADRIDRAEPSVARLHKRDVQPIRTPEPAPLGADGLEEDVVEGGWQPIPVPRPTYTLKDPAPGPRRAPARPTVDPGLPVPIEVEDDEIELMAATHGRRHASGR